MNKEIRFLLVDDDPDDRTVFEEALGEVAPSVQLQTAVNGQDALQKLGSAHNLPDLVFLDLNMPLMDGKQCLVQIKEDPALQRLPVIIYTTSSHSKDIEETMMKGALCFITKPSSLMELKRILSSIAGSLPYNLHKTLQHLSNDSTTFIVC